jgi:hypothetical protein
MMQWEEEAWWAWVKTPDYYFKTIILDLSIIPI